MQACSSFPLKGKKLVFPEPSPLSSAQSPLYHMQATQEKAKAPCLGCLNTKLASAPTKGHQQSLVKAIDTFASWAALSKALFTASLNICSAGLQRPLLISCCAAAPSSSLSLASTSPCVSRRPVFLGFWLQPSPPTCCTRESAQAG